MRPAFAPPLNLNVRLLIDKKSSFPFEVLLRFMISFKTGASRFDLRVAGIFIRESEVLLHRLENDEVWALPGGRVEMGEEAGCAVVREMIEETGELAQCGRLVYVIENFFRSREAAHHEVGLYFLCELRPSSSLRLAKEPIFGMEGNKKLEFRWFSISELTTINLHPAVLKVALSKILVSTEHLVQR